MLPHGELARIQRERERARERARRERVAFIAWLVVVLLGGILIGVFADYMLRVARGL